MRDTTVLHKHTLGMQAEQHPAGYTTSHRLDDTVRERDLQEGRKFLKNVTWITFGWARAYVLMGQGLRFDGPVRMF